MGWGWEGGGRERGQGGRVGQGGWGRVGALGEGRLAKAQVFRWLTWQQT